jgi:hypothetical protein
MIGSVVPAGNKHEIFIEFCAWIKGLIGRNKLLFGSTLIQFSTETNNDLPPGQPHSLLIPVIHTLSFGVPIRRATVK